MKKPILGITLGDPAGVGPEVVLKSLARRHIYDLCRPLAIGDAQTLALFNHGVRLKIRPILNPAQARYRFGTVDVLHLPCRDFSALEIGRPNAASGHLSAVSVQKSVELALTGLVDGVVHAPISKSAWRQAGFRYPGHTEMIARLCGAREVAMAIVAEPLRTVLVTWHVPLAQVSRNLSVHKIAATVRLTDGYLRGLGVAHPRIGVCALNPHAGENGLLGREEIGKVAPAVRQARRRLGARVEGPLPADSAYRDLRKGRYDGLVTLYHDQSLIPLKLYGGERLVNVTLGIPFPRTSPGHGTACDIAGKRKADPRAMIAAIEAAARMCKR